MKRIVLTLFVIALCFNCYSQFIITGTKNGVTYIKPCLENFTYMSTLDHYTFSGYMNQYHYSEGESDAQWYSYVASLDNYVAHAVTNFDFAYRGGTIICWLPKSELYPRTAIQDIYQRLRPHFLRREDGGELFAFNYKGKAFGCIIVNQTNNYILNMTYFGKSDNRLKEL